MNASDKGKAVRKSLEPLNRTCTMIGRRTGCSVAPDQQCKLLTLMDWLLRLDSNQQTLRLTEADPDVPPTAD